MGAERLAHAVEVYPWGHGFGRWLADLTDVTNRDAQARSIAEMVKDFKTLQSDEPVFLVAKSGGSGVVVKALELLDQDAVERVVLLAPALSSTYDLSRALRAVRHEMVVFWSPLDIFILGLGTLIFGTIDRVRARSAGLVGFVAPAESDRSAGLSRDDTKIGATRWRPAQDRPAERDGNPREYAKLRQIRWRPSMVATGYLGGHFGPDSPLFLKRYVLPLLRPGDQQGR
jgi:hypothetical protein